ncbi:PAS domain S-box protein [Poseidonibacter lekithochrous]|uniref:PAS domain S-box protein n=1 Tax=Poseidonibacter lekithochrous TaxID=1904463 RepID=UPI0008FCA26B|nr:PAS domain S-box protein [Poseidonibacter lekithochrous]QKJ23646.1 multi-sensor domain-containing two-component system histidine kinase [Poseidonibacter lekithochrous]
MNSLQKSMNLISNILDIDQSIDGQLYLKEFIKNIAQNLNVKYALIGHPIGEDSNKIHTDVVWADDKFIDNFIYDLKGTPCEIVLTGERVCIHDSNVCVDFPDDQLLQDMNIDSYIGAPVISKNKSGISSILVLLDDKPMKDREFFSIVTEFLALRASAEIEKIHNEERLKFEVEKRTKELNFANQKIFSLNESLELERSEIKFKILFENSPIGMAMIDYESGNFLEVNKSFQESIQYTNEELYSLSYMNITPSEYEEQGLHQIDELNNTGTFGPNEKEYIKKDGSSYPIKISGFSIINPDGKKVVWAIIEDITEVKNQIKNQEIMFHQSKVASLGEMLGNIAHQWRQPLSLISTTATGTKLKKELGILKENEFFENMDSINEKTQYLSKTIDDFRNFFLSDSSSQIKIDTNTIIKKAVSLIKDSFKVSNVEIILNNKNPDDLLYCNENLLIQALINILNNAKDALNLIDDKDFNKYVFIDVTKENDFISIEIKDNGMGIPLKIKDKIFEPYFTTKHKSHGTGIGLYMTNQIITKHLNSRIIVENKEYIYEKKSYVGASFDLILKSSL